MKSNVKSKVKAKKSRAVSETRAPGNSDGIVVRFCEGLAEFEGCIQVERAVWKAEDIDLVPMPLFVVAARTGGQVIGAFDGQLEWSALRWLSRAGAENASRCFHSHMTATLKTDTAIGASAAGSESSFNAPDALARGISLVEWTFDPLMIKNAYFNLMRLGAITRNAMCRMLTVSRPALCMPGSRPTWRFVAEWHLRSPRVARVLAGKSPVPAFSKKARRISIPREPASTREDQSRLEA